MPACEDLGNTVDNGNVIYSTDLKGGQYREGTVATVTCNMGFVSGGSISCQSNGTWTSSLPSCDRELFIYILLINYQCTRSIILVT